MGVNFLPFVPSDYLYNGGTYVVVNFEANRDMHE